MALSVSGVKGNGEAEKRVNISPVHVQTRQTLCTQSGDKLARGRLGAAKERPLTPDSSTLLADLANTIC